MGGHLARTLQGEGYRVFGISRRSGTFEGEECFVGDCNDSEWIEQVFESIRPDYVLHLASRTTPGRDLGDIDAQMVDTVRPALNVAARLPNSVRLGIFFGSCEEYGDGLPPFREEQSSVAFSPYGWGKISARHAVELVARQRMKPVCWVRPFLTFGPGQRGNLLIPQLIRGCLSGEKIEMTPGMQTREFLYVADLCKMVLQILRKPENAVGQVLNLCSGEEVAVRTIAEEIRNLVGSGELDFSALPYRENEAMRFYGSPEKFERLFGAMEFTPRAVALRETVSAFISERRESGNK